MRVHCGETKYLESTTTEGTTSNPPPSNGGNSSCPQTQPGQGVYVCPSAFKRDPNDCNLFYQCTQNEDSFDMTITKFMCPEGMAYNEDECKCAKAQDGDCSGQSRFVIDLRNEFKYSEPPKNTVNIRGVEQFDCNKYDALFIGSFSFLCD